MYYNKKYQDFIDDNFFVIDSDNCKTIKSKLYGFVLLDNKLIAFKNNYNKHIEKKEYGTYINIIKEDEKLIIEQDAIGSYGLFIYQKDAYFAISNSFYYLVLYLNKNKKLTINMDNIKYFMTQPLTTLSITKTPIYEIKQIDKDMKIIIDTEANSVDFVRDKLQQHIFNIDSQECFEILDKWFSKYCSFIQSLSKNNIYFETSLSGGRDTRLVLTLFNHLNLLPKINIRTFTGQTDREKVDFIIASHIAKQYHFQLNNKIDDTLQNKLSSELAFLLTFFMQLGLHKEFYFVEHYHLKPSFRFNGLGGEGLRNTWKMSPTSFINKKVNDMEASTGISRNYQDNFIRESFDYLKKITKENLGSELYNYTWNKTHSGKANAIAMLRNQFSISPLQDPMLKLIKINDCNYDDLLLIAVIYQRYMPTVIDIAITSEQIKQSVKEQADLIQKKYPKNIHIDDTVMLDFGERVIPENEEPTQTPQEILSALFNTSEVINFSRYFINDTIYPYCTLWANSKTMYMNYSDPNTLVAFSLLAKTLLTNEFNFNDYLCQTIN